MNRHYQRISQVLTIVGLAIASTIVSPVHAQSTQPQRGDADRLRPAQGQPISPTNTDQFSIKINEKKDRIIICNIYTYIIL